MYQLEQSEEFPNAPRSTTLNFARWSTLFWIERLRPIYRFLEHPLETTMHVLKFAVFTLAGLAALLAVSL